MRATLEFSLNGERISLSALVTVLDDGATLLGGGTDLGLARLAELRRMKASTSRSAAPYPAEIAGSAVAQLLTLSSRRPGTSDRAARALLP